MTNDIDGSPASDCSFAPGNEAMAVVIRVCEITFAVDSWLFSGVERAMDFCHEKFRMPHGEWEPYLIRSDAGSKLKLNGEPVVYCGWQSRIDETERLLIHSDIIMLQVK